MPLRNVIAPRNSLPDLAWHHSGFGSIRPVRKSESDIYQSDSLAIGINGAVMFKLDIVVVALEIPEIGILKIESLKIDTLGSHN